MDRRCVRRSERERETIMMMGLRERLIKALDSQKTNNEDGRHKQTLSLLLPATRFLPLLPKSTNKKHLTVGSYRSYA